jgi:uncharacterized repeat protein (TIGR02543 family)
MDANKAVTASFAREVHLTLEPATGGTLAASPPGGVYPEGTVVTVTASADPGFLFTGWSGDLTGTANPASLTLDADKTVGAFFDPAFRLSVDIPGGGTVTLDPPGGLYPAGTIVTLTATPDPGWTFTGWSGDLSGTASLAALVMDGDKSVTAHFTRVFTVTTRVTGSGRIDLDPPGGTYLEGTLVTATAVPDAGHEFKGWSGDLTGLANPQTLLLDANKSIRATFRKTRR